MTINCNITSNFRIKKLLTCSGGSDNIILQIVDSDNNKLIVKIIPEMIQLNVKIKPDYHLLEIKFYQFFTKKYLLTNRTIHIVGIYNHQICKNMDKLLKNILQNRQCPTYVDWLTRQPKLDYAYTLVCTLLAKRRAKLVENIYDVILLENCNDSLVNLIERFMNEIELSRRSARTRAVETFILTLQRILFQIIFTLAIIKDDYPGFLHNDLFVRNILITSENQFKHNDYIAYYYRQKIFYLKANGPHAKINDFDRSIIVNELEPSTYQIERAANQFYHINPFNTKTDIFNLLHDIYDGENLGTNSINTWIRLLNIKSQYIKPIRVFLNRFIDVDTIDRINHNNRNLLDQTWNIDKISILEDTVSTPDQYLMSDHFAIYQILPNDGHVIRHLNQPH